MTLAACVRRERDAPNGINHPELCELGLLSERHRPRSVLRRVPCRVLISAIRALALASHSSSPIGRAPFSPAFRFTRTYVMVIML